MLNPSAEYILNLVYASNTNNERKETFATSQNFVTLVMEVMIHQIKKSRGKKLYLACRRVARAGRPTSHQRGRQRRPASACGEAGGGGAWVSLALVGRGRKGEGDREKKVGWAYKTLCPFVALESLAQQGGPHPTPR
jgi:hypothetical protein